MPGLGLLPPCPPGTSAQGNPGPGWPQRWMCLSGSPRPRGELCAASWGAGWDGQTGSALSDSCVSLLPVFVAAPTGLGMEVMAPATINALNGSSVKLSCTFNSCYKVENKQFSLNWTYQECDNCSEELVSLAGAGGLLSGVGTSLK